MHVIVVAGPSPPLPRAFAIILLFVLSFMTSLLTSPAYCILLFIYHDIFADCLHTASCLALSSLYPFIYYCTVSTQKNYTQG